MELAVNITPPLAIWNAEFETAKDPLCWAIRILHSAIINQMAEGTGLEPASPCGRRFSRPLHYQLCYPSG